MEILLKINGTMERFFPATEYTFTLSNNATPSELYDELAITAGAEISPAVWNHKTKRPRGPVIVRSDNGVLKGENQPLYDGQVIELNRFLIGG